MPFERYLLPWKAPVLASAADWLLGRYPTADFSGVTLVLPVSRAGRRLEEILLERCEEGGLTLSPPRVITVGHLPELLWRASEARAAGAIEQQLAWAAALRQADAATLHAIAPHPPEPGDTIGWIALAEQLSGLVTELAGEHLEPADVAARGEQLPDFDDGPRWLAIQAIYDAHVEQLAEQGLADPQRLRWEAIEQGAASPPAPPPPPEGDVIVIAAADLNAMQWAALDRLGDRVTILMHGSDAAAFDAHGGLVAAHWRAAHIDIDEAQVRLVDRPVDQAAAAVRALAELGGKLSAEQISLGVCDDAVVPHLQQQLPGYGVAVRYAAGLAIDRTRPMKLLEAAADWLRRRSFVDLAMLIRHVDVERYLVRYASSAGPRGGETRRAIEDWLTLLDRYYSETLHGKVTGLWLGKEPMRRRLKQLYDAMQSLFSDFHDERRPFRGWAEAVASLLVKLYGEHALRTDEEDDRIVIESCRRIREVLAEIHQLDAPGDSLLMTADEALRLIVRFAAQQPPIPPEPIDAAVEMLGPLELHLDDADALVLTGVNEGMLPKSVNADPFLPNRLRSLLGLMDNERRYARDAYALAAMLASREKVTLIAGRRTADDQPLAPSRLLFACDEEQVPQRVQRFYREGAAAPLILPARLRPAAASAFIVPPPPLPVAEPMTRLSVTAFRDYIACRYRFYLKHVLGLERLDDDAEELDGGAFGSLAHDVLHAFGCSDFAASTDVRQIRHGLAALLDDKVRETYGRDILPAVRVQIEQLRARLEAFAAWQAQWAAEGWRIRRDGLERTFRGDDAVPFQVDAGGEPMLLTGRIDRIDVHETTGEHAVFDYKTGDSGLAPAKTHLSGGAPGQWVDLQLPLYRHLVRSMGVTQVRLGYILLPRDCSLCGAAWAEWSDDDLAAADEVARQVIRDIRAGRFEFAPGDAPAFDEFADICGVDQLIAELSGEAES